MNLARLITTHQTLALAVLCLACCAYMGWLFWVFNAARRRGPRREEIADLAGEQMVQAWPNDPAQRSG